MRIIGYRSTTTAHQWGRPVGDANGAIASGVTEVPVLLVLTDGGITGIGLGAHDDVARVFPALEGEDPRAVTALYDRMLSYVFKAGHAGGDFRGDRRPRHGAVGHQGQARRRAVVAHARGAGPVRARLRIGPRDRRRRRRVGIRVRAVGRSRVRDAKIKGGLDTERDISRLRTVGEVLRKNTAHLH